MRSGDSSYTGEQEPEASPGATMPVAMGTPTAIGSLPHRDPSEAVALVLDALPDLPAAPTLPARDPREGMVAQAAWGLAGVAVEDDGSLVVDPATLDPEAPLGDPALEGEPFVTLRAFLDAVAGRTEALKVQLTGPVTLAAALVDAGVDADLARDVAGPAVRARGRALLDAVAAVAPDAPVVAFLDEPSLVGGMPDRLGDPETLVDLVSGALAVLEPRAVTGLHCCGPSDWRVLLNAGPRVLSVPVGAELEPSAGAVAAFLERGGWVAWGGVPTDGPLGDSPSRWWRDLSAQWCSLVRAGCDPVLIRQQALVTPACGLALHDDAQVRRVLALTRGLSQRIAEQLAGVRLSVGA